jgi:hypothetical protein
MGWSNTTEMAAGIVDELKVLQRLTHNIAAGESDQDRDPIVRTPRPFEVEQEPAKPETINLAQFGDLLKETT